MSRVKCTYACLTEQVVCIVLQYSAMMLSVHVQGSDVESLVATLVVDLVRWVVRIKTTKIAGKLSTCSLVAVAVIAFSIAEVADFVHINPETVDVEQLKKL